MGLSGNMLRARRGPAPTPSPEREGSGHVMDLTAKALVCAVLAHGEAGAVVRFLTAEQGLVAGYVRGGRGRRMRPVLQAGNIVLAHLKSRVDTQLAAATVELVRSREALLDDRLATASLDWLTVLTAATLPEGTPYPQVHAALTGLLDVMDHSEDAAPWVAGVARYELLLLEKLGFGLDLTECAATGARDDLRYVSSKSSRAVSGTAGAPYADRLLPLPVFLKDGGPANWPEIAAGLRTTGHFIERDLLGGDWRERALASRERLVARVTRRAEAC